MADRVITHTETIQTKNGAVDVKVIVSVSAIARQLGGRAVQSKGKRAIEINGLVQVRAPK